MVRIRSSICRIGVVRWKCLTNTHISNCKESGIIKEISHPLSLPGLLE